MNLGDDLTSLHLIYIKFLYKIPKVFVNIGILKVYI